jgi:hypothetical protein
VVILTCSKSAVCLLISFERIACTNYITIAVHAVDPSNRRLIFLGPDPRERECCPLSRITMRPSFCHHGTDCVRSVF